MAKAAAAGAAAPANGAAAAGGTGNEGGAAPAAGAAGAGDGAAAAAAGAAAAGDGAAGAAGAAEGGAAAGKAGGDGNAAGEGDKGKGAAAGDAGAAAGAAKAPAKYELKLPAGGLMDTTDLPALEKIARENDMSQEEAQAYLDEMGVTLKAQSDGYLAQLKADPDYGGDKLAESQRLANQFIDRLRPAGHARRDSFLRFLNRGGALNHPEVVALLADAGKLMDEDGHVQGAGARAGAVDTATKMYDHPTSKAADGRT